MFAEGVNGVQGLQNLEEVLANGGGENLRFDGCSDLAHKEADMQCLLASLMGRLQAVPNADLGICKLIPSFCQFAYACSGNCSVCIDQQQVHESTSW